MIRRYTENTTNALFTIGDESTLADHSVSKRLELFTFIRTTHKPATLRVDSAKVNLPEHSIIALTPDHFVEILTLESSIVHQFNRVFYCIKDHDLEVRCAGLLFYGNDHAPVISLSTEEQKKFRTLHDVLLDEMEQNDRLRAQMLRILMARYIIKTTNLLRQSQGIDAVHKRKIDLLRKFNLLVENHFREDHSVSFYAEKLNKSPKTLSNNFSKLGKSPLHIIHDRIILEAQRQLSNTGKPAKQIAHEVGFEDASHLSRLYKNNTGISPTEFRKRVKVERN